MTRTDWPLAIGRARLFLVSYAPLALMFAARFLASDRWQLATAFAIVGVWGFVDGWRLVRGASERSKRRVHVTKVTDQGGAVAAYLATYLLPFLGNLPSNWGDWIAYSLYFATALVVYVRSDLAVVNPTLYALGFRVVRGRVNDQESLIISRFEVEEGSTVRASEAMHVVVAHELCDDRTR